MTDDGPAEITRAEVVSWVEAYLHAWQTNASGDITALFTADGRYVETPYDTRWVGRDRIVAGWQSRWEWQQGGWGFEWELTSIEGRTATIVGVGTYTELGVFDNVWTVTFARDGRCTRFHMVNTERA